MGLGSKLNLSRKLKWNAELWTGMLCNGVGSKIRGLEKRRIKGLWGGKSKTKGQLEVHMENHEIEAA